MSDQETVSVAQQRVLKIPAGLKSLIEGLIFAAEEPLTVRQIKAIYEQPGGDQELHIDQQEIQTVIETLNEEYRTAKRPYRIINIAGGFQFATLKEYAEWLGRLFHEQARRKLSQSSLETLAIVSYKQPISKPEIEAIRGVNCDYVLKTLLEKELLTIVGRAETVGRPLLYGTTREFLKHFGLNEITDLPRPREIEEILGESQFETERRMLEAQSGADQMKKDEEDFKSRLPHIPRKKSELDEEVHIIPKTRTRRLNLRVKEEEPASDGPIPVPESDPPAVEDDALLSVVVQEEEPQLIEPPPIDLAGSRGLSEPPADVMPEPPQGVGGVPEEIPEDTQESFPSGDYSSRDEQMISSEGLPLTSSESLELREIAPEIADPDLPVNAVLSSTPSFPPNEPEDTQPRRSPWTSWKAKIQTFIRKLFG